MSKCTAPVDGHQDAATKAKCPACGTRSSASTAAMVSSFPPVNAPAYSYDESVDLSDVGTSPVTLDEFADNPDETLRMTVARNPSTPAETLVRLVLTDEDDYVREEAAGNTSLPSDVVPRLFKDGFYGVRMSAAERSDSRAEDLGAAADVEVHDQVMAALIANPRTPLSRVRHMLSLDSESVAEVIVESDALPTHILDALSWSEHASVRRSVGWHLSTSWETRARLAASDDESDRTAAQLGFEDDEKPFLGFEGNNSAARKQIAKMEWWTLTEDSPDVHLTRAINSNL